MNRYTTFVRLVIIAILVIALGALAGWYYFLRGAEEQTSVADTARGYGSTAPSFEGSTGSTYANIVSTLGQEVNATTTSNSRLWEVSEVPVAGFGWVGNSTEPSLYFVERSSGYVFEADTNGRNVSRLTDTLRPKTYEALISNDGSILERSVDDSGNLLTFAGVIGTSTDADATSTTDSLQGADLPDGIHSIAADVNSDELFYTISQPSGVSLVSTNWNGTKETNLFSSPIAGWRLIAPGDGSVVLLQDPLDAAEGYAYRVQKGGTLSLLAQGPGLTLLPRAASTALIFGTSLDGALSLFAQTSAQASPSPLSIQTVADKCAWAPTSPEASQGKPDDLIAYCGVPETIPSQQFLDDWYKGIVHTSDEFYEVDASAASTTLLYDPSGDTNAKLDVEDPVVDPSGQDIAFINAADQSLWVLRIAQ